jgi:Outer membrane protein beta-barrel domain
MRYTGKSFCISLVFLLAVSTVHAQGISTGSGEASGNIGFSNLKGADNNRHVTFGGSALYNLSPVAGLGFEYHFAPMGSLTQGGVTATGHMQLFGGVARFSLTDSSRVVPYVVVAAGGNSLHAAASAGNITVSASQNGFYGGFGGGASIYAGTNWGIRPEFRYVREHFNSTSIQGISVSSFGQNDYQGSVAVFYQFGGKSSSKH